MNSCLRIIHSALKLTEAAEAVGPSGLTVSGPDSGLDPRTLSDQDREVRVGLLQTHIVLLHKVSAEHSHSQSAGRVLTWRTELAHWCVACVVSLFLCQRCDAFTVTLRLSSTRLNICLTSLFLFSVLHKHITEMLTGLVLLPFFIVIICLDY